MVFANDHCAVWVAKDDLCAHIDELVHKEETALKHLLMNEDGPLGLCRYNEEDAQQVWCQSWPRRISDGEDRAIHKGLYLVTLSGGYNEVIASLYDLNAELAKHLRDEP